MPRPPPDPTDRPTHPEPDGPERGAMLRKQAWPHPRQEDPMATNLKIHAVTKHERQIGVDTFEAFTRILDCDDSTTVDDVVRWAARHSRIRPLTVEIVADEPEDPDDER